MRKKQLEEKLRCQQKPAVSALAPLSESIMRKAIEKKMGDSEIREAIGFLRSKDQLMGTMAICSLTDVDWIAINARTRNSAFCALELFAREAGRALASAARRVQKAIVNASLGGGYDEERKAA